MSLCSHLTRCWQSFRRISPVPIDGACHPSIWPQQHKYVRHSGHNGQLIKDGLELTFNKLRVVIDSQVLCWQFPMISDVFSYEKRTGVDLHRVPKVKDRCWSPVWASRLSRALLQYCCGKWNQALVSKGRSVAEFGCHGDIVYMNLVLYKYRTVKNNCDKLHNNLCIS